MVALGVSTGLVLGHMRESQPVVHTHNTIAEIQTTKLYEGQEYAATRETIPIRPLPTATPSPAPTPVPESITVEETGYTYEEDIPYNPIPTTTISDNTQGSLERLWVALTFYNCYGQGGGFCGAMASGNVVYEGAAACGSAIPRGTQFTVEGDNTIRTCEDTGRGGAYWVDIFFWDYNSGRAWRNNFASDGVVINVL